MATFGNRVAPPLVLEVFAAGDGAERTAFTRLYERQAPRIFRFLRDLLGDSTLAADATQETFARAYQRHREILRDEGRAVPWLFGVARNVSLELRKARARAGRIFVCGVESVESAPSATSPERDALVREDGPAFVPEARTAGGAMLAGPANAKRTVLVFIDFECPYCKRLDLQLRELAGHDDVRIVVRNKPLPFHEHARLAAKAAIAADRQGKVAAMTKEMFDHQDALDRASLMIYAERAGLDITRFTVDLDGWDTEARLVEDEALGSRLGVKGTPTSFVDGRRVVGAQALARFTD